MYMQLRQHPTHQHHHLTPTINDDGHITANTTTLIGSFFFFFFFLSFFLFYFTNKYCYSSMYMQRWRRCPTHQHNHLTRWPSTTTATSQPTQPPWLVGFILFLFSCFFFLLINIAIVLCTCNDNYDGWTINTNHLTPRPSTMTAMSQPTQLPWSVGFFFFFFFFFVVLFY